MKRLLRSKTTRAFVAKDGSWTHDIDQAQHFDDAFQAYRTALALSLQDAEVYCAFLEEGASPDCDFVIPLDRPDSRPSGSPPPEPQ